MSKHVDLTGLRFGRLLVIEFGRHTKNGENMWLCRCDCGKEKIIRGTNLRGTSKNAHQTRSCGCLYRHERAQRMSQLTTKHGLCCKKEYRIWRGIITRCYNPNSKIYHYYGGRGIKVCDKWLKSAEAFYKDMGQRPSSKYSINRIDNDGNYCPENCRWSRSIDQAKNKFRAENISDEWILKEVKRRFDIQLKLELKI